MSFNKNKNPKSSPAVKSRGIVSSRYYNRLFSASVCSREGPGSPMWPLLLAGFRVKKGSEGRWKPRPQPHWAAPAALACAWRYTQPAWVISVRGKGLQGRGLLGPKRNPAPWGAAHGGPPALEFGDVFPKGPDSLCSSEQGFHRGALEILRRPPVPKLPRLVLQPGNHVAAHRWVTRRLPLARRASLRANAPQRRRFHAGLWPGLFHLQVPPRRPGLCYCSQPDRLSSSRAGG